MFTAAKSPKLPPTDLSCWNHGSAEMFQVSFAIRVNLLHACTLMGYYYLFAIFLT